MLGGLFWGALCGALTNLVAHSIWFWGWEGYLFAICSVITALVTWLFIRLFPRELNLEQAELHVTHSWVQMRKSRRLGTVIDRMVVLILLSFCLCLAMSVSGGLIAALIQIFNKSVTGNPDISIIMSATMFSQNLSIILREILSRIPINIIDRLVSGFAGYGIALGLYSIPALRGLLRRIA